MPFPSPAEDHRHPRLNLNDLIVHPEATFLMRMGSMAMEPLIRRGDVLIVDRALDASIGRVIVAIVRQEMLVRKLTSHGGSLWLMAENTAYDPVKVFPDTLHVWGVVTYSVHKLAAPTKKIARRGGSAR